jgi:hypothetical protein
MWPVSPPEEHITGADSLNYSMSSALNVTQWKTLRLKRNFSCLALLELKLAPYVSITILSCLLFRTQRFGDRILSPSLGGTYSVEPNRQS